MSVFDGYAEYYDLLYGEKDYQGEVKYVLQHIQNRRPDAETILDLGCGTGRHAQELALRGYKVVGVDQSPRMIETARSRTDGDESTSFYEGDVRSVEIGRSFDAVISLFHVISYQQSNDEIRRTFEVVRDHLSKGGIFVFDCWYGPAVLTIRPEIRVKRLEGSGVRVTRIAEPKMYPDNNLVDVEYSIFVEDTDSGRMKEIRETHTMRYLFTPELHVLLGDSGLDLLSHEEWMTRQKPGFDTWSVTFIAQAN